MSSNPSRAPVDPTPIPAPRRLIVADDEALVATGICSSLESLGYDIIGPVANGQAALDTSRTEHPDLAILDIRMPVLDGLACAAALWSELQIPAIIVSAYSSQNYVDEAQEAGVFAYLLKPITTESLRTTVSVAWASATKQIQQARRIDQLEESLAVRRTVEMAKWKIIEARAIAEPEAHALLQRAARNDRRRLVDVADEVLKNPAHPLLRKGSHPIP